MNLPVPVTPGQPSLFFGSTDLDATDFVPPRVKILQPMSKETGDGNKPGDLFNTLTSQNYGPSLVVAPIIPLKQRVFLLRDVKRPLVDTIIGNTTLAAISEGEGLKCRSLDMLRGVGEPGDELWEHGQKGCHECPLAAWQRGGGKNTPPPCTETYNVAAITMDGDFVIVGMAKSGARTGKQWFSMLRLNLAAPWSRQYEVTTREEKNAQGKFWVPLVRLLPGAPPSDVQATAQTFHKELSGRVIDVTPVAEDAEEEGAGDVRDDTPDLADAAF